MFKKDENIKATIIGVGKSGVEVLTEITNLEAEFIKYIPLEGNIDKIDFENVKESLKDTDLIYLISNVGNENDYDLTTIVSKISKDMGILTIVLTVNPNDAKENIEKLKKNVDCIINNELFKLTIDNILKFILKIGIVNLDFYDIKHILTNTGEVFIGVGNASGENRNIEVVKNVIPNINLKKSKSVIVSITATSKLGLADVVQILNSIKLATGNPENLMFEVIVDDNIGDKLEIIIIVTI